MTVLRSVIDHGRPAIAIGGGLAGGAFALELARHGHRVKVLERSREPQHKVCGEFVSEEARILLDSLGIDIDAHGATDISRFRLVKGERQATSPLPFRAAAMSRLKLDALLLEAASRAGADVVPGVAATGLENGRDRITVRSEHMHFEASAVALATGKHALRGVPRPMGRMIGFKMHFDPSTATLRDLAGVVQLVFFRGGYIGACLVEDKILSVGWVVREELLRDIGAGWESQREHLSRQSSFIGDHIARAKLRMDRPVAVAGLSYGYLRAEPIGPAIYPIGDQLAVIPSFTGDGMSIALYSGITAARAVLNGQPAEQCQQEMIGRLRPQFRVASAIGRMLETPLTCGISVVAAGLFPGLISTVARATRLRGVSPAKPVAFVPVQRSATTK